MLQGEVGKAGVTPALPLGLQPGQPFRGGKGEDAMQLSPRMLCFIPAVNKNLMHGSFGNGERPTTVCFTLSHSDSNLPFQINVAHHPP